MSIYEEIKTSIEQAVTYESKTDDSFIVTYDCCPPDCPTLCIARKEKDKVRVLNIIHGDEALYGYAWLTGFAELKEFSKGEVVIDENIFPNGYGKYQQRPLEIHFEGEDKQ